jgi:glyoxylase-like metal-dependent hydrolase (beta-lactamase superfamily II)/ferredoxin
MANPTRRHPANVPGPWFVDDSCIDCDASRQCAPTIFEEIDGQSVVVRQPETPAELADAARALLCCPTASIGVTGPKPDLEGVLPFEIDDGVYLCGYNSRDSYGANSFFVRRPEGNLLVDAPRYVAGLARRLGELGGIADVLLTHRDDVADAARYAELHGARVWIHAADRDAAPFATHILQGREPTIIRPGLRAIPVPGHTRGSVVYHLEDRYLFTGDSLHWSRSRNDLGAFRDACWYSWEEQAESLARLIHVPFEWVLAGHGDRRRRPAPEMRMRLARLVERMRQGTHDRSGASADDSAW